jgi:hypothetical protein
MNIRDLKGEKEEAVLILTTIFVAARIVNQGPHSIDKAAFVNTAKEMAKEVLKQCGVP